MQCVWKEVKKPQKDDFEIVVSCEKFDLIGMENEI